MQIVWGQEPEVEERAASGAPSLMELSVSYGWCLSDVELAEMQSYQESLTNATADYMTDEELERLRSALEIAYQSRSWSVSARSDARLQHAVAVARVLAELRMEVSAVCAALLAGVCEDAGITYAQIESRLGVTVANAVRDVSNVWRISQLLRSHAEGEGGGEARGGEVGGGEARGGEVGGGEARGGEARGGEVGGGEVGGGEARGGEARGGEARGGEARTEGSAGPGLHPGVEGVWSARSPPPPSEARGPAAEGSADADETERRCQMMLAGCDDWRGVVLSLASRLVSMRQLRLLEASNVPLPPPPAEPPHPWAEDDVQLQLDRLVRQQTQKEIPRGGYDAEAAAAFAGQTLHVFVPIAHRLGMWFFKTELEELCFATLQPDAFRNLSASLRTVREEHSGVLEVAARRIRAALRADPILAKHAEEIRVQARMKTAYSAWAKMRRKGVALQALHDVLGLRIIFRPTCAGKLTSAHHWQRQTILCYRALEVVHRLYPPLPGRRIKDYVASPKSNGYQSLHSSIGLSSVRAEVQVRTAAMHRYAEYGKASHWLYKSDESDGLDDWFALAERTRRTLPRELAGFVNLPSNNGKLPSASGLSRAPRAAPATVARAGGSGLTASPARQYDGSAAGFSLLENLRLTLRERRVYALVRDSYGGGPQVLALQAGARLEDALRELRARRRPEAATATVNGRQVRRDYRIRHGDLLTLVPRAALNSASWLEGGGAGRAGDEDGGVGGGVPVPVPWPWSLIDDGCEWYAEAELKHGAVAILALANWLLLCLLGETSLGAEPLESVGTPLGGIAWASQFGAVALLEASVMHVATSHAISRLGLDGSGDWRSIPRWLRFLPPADHPTSVAVAELSRRVRPASLWLGRAAMLAMASLALRADLSSAAGILHSVVERPHASPVAELLRGAREGAAEHKAARTPQALPEARRGQRPMERAASLYGGMGIEPIALDVVLQDVWPDDSRS